MWWTTQQEETRQDTRSSRVDEAQISIARYSRHNRRRRFGGAGNTHRLTMVLLSFIFITPVDAVQIRVPGGVQQCHAAALAFLQGTPPYDINIVQDSGDPLLQVRQTQNTLLWLANAAAGTRVDVEVSDDDGGVADLSLVVDSSDDDSCLDSSGDSVSSTTPSTSPGPSPSYTSTPATSSTFVTTSTTFDATSSRLSVTAQSSARTSSGPTSEGSSSSSLLLSTSSSERTTPSTTSAIASSIGVTLLPSSSASAQLARKSGLGTAAVAGISAVSAAVALSILGVLYWRCMRYRAERRRRNDTTAESLGAHPFETPSSSSDSSTKASKKHHSVNSPPTSLLIDGGRRPSTDNQTMRTSGSEMMQSNSVVHIHTHELDSVAAQPTILGRFAMSQTVEAHALHGRTASNDKSLSSHGVPSTDHPVREDVPAGPRPSPSDIALPSWSNQDGSRSQGGDQFVYEIDGGVRLAGGHPGDIAGCDEEPPPMATFTLPPPYQRY
ncbi:hypothetical protein OH76DRAFT_200118 [Lentinus brumalis]|uniref:Uncharacterized protein n=1 Tax=Lentinus brumalis TaxID=2498619 RepID=A0A371DI76_9APHY|nr:hypothetical protein OH76DRAFT_200118 [Polyporus brumalis]